MQWWNDERNGCHFLTTKHPNHIEICLIYKYIYKYFIGPSFSCTRSPHSVCMMRCAKLDLKGIGNPQDFSKGKIKITFTRHFLILDNLARKVI